MSKIMKTDEGGTKVAYLEPHVKNYDFLLEKVKEINLKFEEIQKLTEEIESMEYPFEYQIKWQSDESHN